MNGPGMVGATSVPSICNEDFVAIATRLPEYLARHIPSRAEPL